ncbi:hypothetical protein Tco_0056310, partial [Tanacetum coccineum]
GSGDDDDSCGVVVAVVGWISWGGDGSVVMTRRHEVVVAWWRRVEARGSADRVDRLTRITFGFGRKSTQEKFSGGSDGGGWWPAVARIFGE